MLQKKSNPWMRSKVLYVIPMAVLVLSAFATPKFVTPIQGAVKNLEEKGKQNLSVRPTGTQESTIIYDGDVPEVVVPHDENRHLAFTEEATIIVDGKEITKEVASQLTTADVNHVEVLRSEAARAFYGENTKPTVVVITTKDGEIVDKPETLPEFKGGVNEMFGWLARNIKYPAKAQENGIQGRMMVQFVVEKDGSVSSVQAIRMDNNKAENGKSLSEVVVSARNKDRSQFATDEEYQQDKEALRESVEALISESERVVRLMSGQWEPGYITKDGEKKAVRTRFVLPIMFRLN